MFTLLINFFFFLIFLPFHLQKEDRKKRRKRWKKLSEKSWTHLLLMKWRGEKKKWQWQTQCLHFLPFRYRHLLLSPLSLSNFLLHSFSSSNYQRQELSLRWLRMMIMMSCFCWCNTHSFHSIFTLSSLNHRFTDFDSHLMSQEGKEVRIKGRENGNPTSYWINCLIVIYLDCGKEKTEDEEKENGKEKIQVNLHLPLDQKTLIQWQLKIKKGIHSCCHCL